MLSMSGNAVPGVYRLSYADWLRMPDDGRLYELIEGDLYVTPPPAIAHQRISRDIEFKLITHLRATGAGEVFDAPVGVRLSDEDIFEPDIVLVLREHADRIGSQVIDGAPDLVVEILSPGTARRDLGPKRQKYEAAGVREYWIVDPESRSIEVLALEHNVFVRHGLFRRHETLSSRLLADFTLVLAEVIPA